MAKVRNAGEKRRHSSEREVVAAPEIADARATCSGHGAAIAHCDWAPNEDHEISRLHLGAGRN
jgi:hypothetical protein